jgi:RNA recognition motif-containing protein
MGSRLYVGNISYQTNEQTLRELFSQGGKKVDEVAIIMDRETGRSRGFAFVTMATPEDAQKAIQELDGQMVDGRTLRINEARERQPRSGGGGPPRFDRGGGGGFGGDRPGLGGGGGPPPAGDRDNGRRARRFGPDAKPGGGDDDRPRKKRGGGGGGGGRRRDSGGDDFDY